MRVPGITGALHASVVNEVGDLVLADNPLHGKALRCVPADVAVHQPGAGIVRDAFL